MNLYDRTLEPLTGAPGRRRQHETRNLVRQAVAVFGALLAEHVDGESFRTPIPVEGLTHLELELVPQGRGAAHATFWRADDPLTTSALCSGLDPAADREVLSGLASLWHAVYGRLLRDVAPPPLPRERPCILTLPLPTCAEHLEDMRYVPDMETCLAAAWCEHWLPARPSG